MHSIKRLAVWVVILSGCANLPPPPQGHLYLHWNDKALCSDLQTGDACASIPMASTNKYYLFDPPTWKATQDYIDALIRYARKQTNAGEESFFSSSAENDALLDALYKIKFAMHAADETFTKGKKR